jgi:hypothetical protein
MSTTFGVKPEYKYLRHTMSVEEDDIIEIAFRSRSIVFTNPLAALLPDDTEVIAMDNTPQGIYTIGDIKKEMDELYKKEKL